MPDGKKMLLNVSCKSVCLGRLVIAQLHFNSLGQRVVDVGNLRKCVWVGAPNKKAPLKALFY